MTRKKLPIGIQTFAKLRQDGCYYVDKTGFALGMIEQRTYYFLSRARRFGKSLLLFDKRQFRPWWFATATPTFLVEVLTERHQFIPRLGQQVADLVSSVGRSC
jgi:hypothetical protein